MSYDNAIIERYTFNDATFGATTVTHNIIGPKGAVGFVRDITVDITTALVGTTTVPEIDVGTSSGDSTYGRYRLGSAAGTGYGTGVKRASQEVIKGNPPRQLSDFAGHVVLDGGPLTSQGIAGGSYSTVVPSGRIPADTVVVITNKAGVGGVPAGGGTVTVDIEWQGQPIQ